MSCNNDSGGIKGILKVIVALQDNAEENCEAVKTCDKPFLGPSEHKRCFNTRPIMLFTDDGEPFKMPFENECCEEECCDDEHSDCEENHNHKKERKSSIFRVEKVDDNTATCRILEKCCDDDDDEFCDTDSFFTINIGCICVIKCLRDTFVAL